jgi:hypothetical protein
MALSAKSRKAVIVYHLFPVSQSCCGNGQAVRQALLSQPQPRPSVSSISLFVCGTITRLLEGHNEIEGSTGNLTGSGSDYIRMLLLKTHIGKGRIIILLYICA